MEVIVEINVRFEFQSVERRMSFWYLQFSHKMDKKNGKNQFYYYGTSSRIVFVHFLGESKTPKRHFEINWPLLNMNWNDKNYLG